MQTRQYQTSLLRGLPLKKLHLYNTRVADLKPITGMRLEYINLVKTKVTDLSALRGMPLTSVRLNGCDELKDISGLQGCTTLRDLTLPEKAENFEFLRSLPSLQRLSWNEDVNNGWRPEQTAREFWQDYEQLTYAKAIEKSGFVPTKIYGGWSFQDKPVVDLSILQGQPIRSLHLGGTKVSDLKPLKGMPLKDLWLYSTPVTDLSPLAGMALEHLNLNSTAIADISILRGMPMKFLRLTRCSRLEDITPLREIKTLEELTLPPNAKNIEVLRNLPNLKRLSYYEDSGNGFRPETTTAEFWSRFDRMKAMASFNAVNPPELPKDTLTAVEATKRFNETVSVRFTVQNAGKSRDEKWYFLNSSEDYRSPENFTIAIKEATPTRLKQLGVTDKVHEMVGKTVVVKGKVVTFSSRPQIVVSDEDWIWIVE